MLTEKPPELEHHYSVQEVATQWGVSARTIRRMFENEPDVLKLCNARQLQSSRARKITLRIPASAIARVHQYWSHRVVAEPKSRRSRIK